MNNTKKSLYMTSTIIFLSVIINANCIAQNNYSKLIEDSRKEIQKSMKKRKVVGASIILFEGDSIIWKEGFGYANKRTYIFETF